MNSDKGIELVICMGSSCFARGNQTHLAIVEDYLAKHQIAAQVELSGCHCLNECNRGLNLRIAGQTFHDVVGRELGHRVTTNLRSGCDLPPTSKLDGIDLVTEGILTLTRSPMVADFPLRAAASKLSRPIAILVE